MNTSMALTLTSTAFQESGKIPADYTCTGPDITPDLHWTDPPAGTKSFALIVDDPDAPMGVWTHWVMFNLPASLRQWTKQEADAQKAVQGYNSWKQLGYRGPCPPRGEHRYFFTLYALDVMLDLAKAPDATTLTTAMEGHVVGKAVLMGKYRKP